MRQLRSHAEISSLIFRCCFDIISVLGRLQLHVNVLGHLGKVSMDLEVHLVGKTFPQRGLLKFPAGRESVYSPNARNVPPGGVELCMQV